MKTAIVYSSKYGTTKSCAALLENSLSDSVTLINIEESPNTTIDLATFDTVIIGGAIHMGKISKKLNQFCQNNLQDLLTKQVAIYLCCGFSEEYANYLQENFPKTLLTKATITAHFGGETKLDSMKLLDKLIVKAALKNRPEALHLIHENITGFSQYLNYTSSQLIK